MSRLLKITEAFLYVLVIADIALLVASVARQPSYEPWGGVSLIVLLLAVGIIRGLRTG